MKISWIAVLDGIACLGWLMIAADIYLAFHYNRPLSIALTLFGMIACIGVAIDRAAHVLRETDNEHCD